MDSQTICGVCGNDILSGEPFLRTDTSTSCDACCKAGELICNRVMVDHTRGIEKVFDGWESRYGQAEVSQ